MIEKLEELSQKFEETVFKNFEDNKKEFFAVKMSIFLLGIKEFLKEDSLLTILEKVDTYDKFMSLNIEKNSELTEFLNIFQNQSPEYLDKMIFSNLIEVKKNLSNIENIF